MLGTCLALAPMAGRNLAVTGHADLGPVHGGGTAFFIGNHDGATGLWHAGGLLSANVGTFPGCSLSLCSPSKCAPELPSSSSRFHTRRLPSNSPATTTD